MNNSLILMGNLGADPELRYTQSGKPVCSFRIAVYQGQNHDDFWVSCTAWDQVGTCINHYFKKGARVRVAGRLREETWSDSNTGEQRKKFSMVVDMFGWPPPKREGQGGSRNSPPAQGARLGGGGGRPGGAAPARPGARPGGGLPPDTDELAMEDVPF